MGKKKGTRKTGTVTQSLAPAPSPPVYDYVKAAGLKLDPDYAEYINGIMATDPQEVLYQVERELETEAGKQFDRIGEQIREQEAERVRLWGKKYPPVPGMKPGEEPKEVLKSRKTRKIELIPIPFSKERLKPGW